MSVQPLFLCLYVPEFAAQARLRHRPAMRSEAIAILNGIPPLQTVCSTTRKARELGVTRGTTRAELDSYPGVTALRRSEPEERSAAAALLAMLWNVSPRAQVLPARDGAHRVVADISGTERIFGTPARLAQDVLKASSNLGLLVRAAISDNFSTAVSVARHAGTAPRVIARGCEREALAPLPLEAIDSLTQQQREVFALWGLHTLGEVAALPEAELIARMGQPGRQLRLLARGQHPHLMQPEEEHFTLEEHASFDTAVEMLDSLLFVLSPMLDQLVARAGARALALASVTVQLDLTSHAAEDTAEPQNLQMYRRTIKPALPLAESRVLLKLLHLDLQAHPPGAPVIAVHLTAEPGDTARAQLGIFSPQLPEPSRLDVTLARIRALVGEGRVGRPVLLDDHRPESFAVEQFTMSSKIENQDVRISRKLSASLSATQIRHTLSRQTQPAALALRRLRPPVLLHMRISNDGPNHFFWQGTRYDVDKAYGPWHQSGGWWSSSAWSWEEWDIAASASDGAKLACRVAHDMLRSQWHLEGLYD